MTQGFGSLAWLCAAWVFAVLPANASSPCRDLVGLTDINRAVVPGTPVPATQDVPRHCFVRGDVNGNIGFEMRLPDRWNGRLLMRGTGGLSGYIADTHVGLDDGYAVVSTDTGHKGPDAAFLKDDRLAIDYAYRAVHLVTAVAKDIVATYYDRPPDRSYFSGCSNGGRQGLIEALYFPDDFDGIVVGAPAIESARIVIWMLWTQQVLRANPIPASKLAVIDRATREACDGLDGVDDGIINDPRACTIEHFEPADLECERGDRADCLTSGQVESLTQLYRGIELRSGENIAPGLAIGAEGAGDWQYWLTGTEDQRPTNESLSNDVLRNRYFDDPHYDLGNFDIETDRQTIYDRGMAGDVTDTDFARFRNRGSKLLVWQGWNDAITRAKVLMDYYRQVSVQMGDPRDFFRVFMMPGVAHCGGGSGPDQADFLNPLVKWVEEDVVPESIIATKVDENDEVVMTRPVCALPLSPVYSGSGRTNEAASFLCE